MAIPTVAPDPGVQLGSNLDAAPHEIPNGMGRYVQDVLLDIPGIVRQRGPIKSYAVGTNPDFPGLPTTARIIGLTSLADPNGTDSFRLALFFVDKNTGSCKVAFYGRGVAAATQAFHSRAFFELMEPLSVDGQLIGDPFAYFDDRRTATLNIGQLINTVALPGPLTIQNSETDPFFSSALSLDGGALIGMGQNYGADASRSLHRAMFHWRGAAKADYAMGVPTLTLTQNSAAVVGTSTSFTTLVEPGMFLVDTNGRLLGVVKSITDNTHLTLEQNVLNTTVTRGTDKFTSIRRPYSNIGNSISAGTITTSTGSAVVNGGGTKFVDQGVSGGLVFRESDYTYIGTVTSVQSNTQLTLTGNATVALASEKYIIVAPSALWPAGGEPVFAAFYNGMQLLASADNSRGGLNERSRIFVTETKNLDAIDLTKTGTFYDLPSTKPHTDIRGMFPTEAAAVVFLGETTYGLFGNTPTSLTPKVIYNDGLLSPMAIQAYHGGCVWAGHRSVYYFDGANVHDLLAGKASAAHQKALAQLDYSKYRAWSMLHNDHYVLFLQKINKGVFSYTQGRTSTSDSSPITYDPDSIIYSINMISGALTFWTNVNVRGFTAPPGKLVNIRDAYYVVESSVTAGPIICSAEALFQETGVQGYVADPFLTNPRVVDFAPHFYVEGKLDAFGDPEHSKRTQLVLVQYSLLGNTLGSGNQSITNPADSVTKLGIDLVTGMGEVTKSVAVKPSTSISVAAPTLWVNKRSRFSIKATMMGVRFYTMLDGQPAAARLGPWSIGWKWLRAGRV